MASAGDGRRVLIIVQNLPVPFDRRVWLEATSLREAGYEVSVICPKGKGHDASYEELEGVEIHRYGLPVEASGTLGFLFEFAWCFLRTSMKSARVAWRGPCFDVIHACNPPDTYWLLARFWRMFGVKFVFDHHDLCPEMYEAKFGERKGFLYSALRFLERMTYRTADVSLATNESYRRAAIDRGGMPEDRVFVVRSGPDLEKFTRYPRDETWHAGREHLLVYLGEMCVQDGVDYLVRALRHLRDDLGRDDFHCVLVGGGPHQAAIRKYAAEQNVDDLTTFTGFVSDDELCRILSSADLAVDPDPKSPWSDKSTMNKIMEYMYFGLPIASFDLTENRYSARESAAYAKSNDEMELARTIDRLLDDPERRSRMSEFGRRRLREELAWEHSVPHLLAAYERVFRPRDRDPARPDTPRSSPSLHPG